jgi:hypothetical protein
VIDVHQHLWPDSLREVLNKRAAPPRIRRDGVLLLDGELPAPVDPADHDPVRRARLDGAERILVALSHPLGLEALPADEAHEALAAWHDGAFALGDPFGVWGTVALTDAAPADVDAILDRGAVGLSLPAGALAGPEGYDRLGPVLERLAAREAPLFVHPGAAAVPPGPRPAWWSALTDYVAQMQVAWFAFLEWGRPAHPALRVVFAMCAGGAPLQLERLAARGGPAAAAHDTGIFYDTSSYGVRTLDALIRVVGVDQLVYGSDRPVAEPPPTGMLGPAAHHVISTTNVLRLLQATPAEAGIR